MDGDIRNGSIFAMFSLICAWQDLRTRRIHIGIFLAFGTAGLLCSFLDKRPPGDMVLALLPGVLFFMASFLSREAVGPGDALWLITAAAFADLRDLMIILCIACFLCMLAVFGLALRHRADLRRMKKIELPFTAFLALPSVAGLLL